MAVGASVNACAVFAAALLLPSNAHAQFQVFQPVGETYRLETAGAFWNPTADFVVASDGMGITGTPIDLKRDLAFTDHRTPVVRVVAHPGLRHKLRFEYMRLKYDATATLPRDVIFNGITFGPGQPVTGALDWRAWRIGYEYDFIARARGFAGLIVEAKQTDIEVRLKDARTEEVRRTRVPVPAVGGILRVYPATNLSLTAELTGIKVPDRDDKKYGGHYVDVDVYWTLNFRNSIGAQFGYRRLGIRHLGASDSGNLTLKGIYIGAVIRD